MDASVPLYRITPVLEAISQEGDIQLMLLIFGLQVLGLLTEIAIIDA
jgi:hypothetical protein